jgi:hypothetical protein
MAENGRRIEKAWRREEGMVEIRMEVVERRSAAKAHRGSGTTHTIKIQKLCRLDEKQKYRSRHKNSHRVDGGGKRWWCGGFEREYRTDVVVDLHIGAEKVRRQYWGNYAESRGHKRPLCREGENAPKGSQDSNRFRSSAKNPIRAPVHQCLISFHRRPPSSRQR